MKIKIGAGISEIENKKTTEKRNKTKSYIFQNINKSDKPLAKPTNLKKKTSY